MFEISSGKVAKAQKVVLYGVEGIGKSTFASHFPNPLFIDTEGSTNNMDVRRLPAPTSWQMLMQEVEWVKHNPQECSTLVIDTMDWAEQMALEHICASKQVKSIEDFGYGKGHVFLTEEVGRLLNRLSDLVEIGINVVLTAHALIRKFEQPDELGAYDRWELKLQKRNAPLVKEWADILLFANYKTMVSNVDGQGAIKGKNKAQGNRRVIYTTHNACWDAKNRHGLAPELEFDYNQIQHIFLQRIFPTTPIEVVDTPSLNQSIDPIAQANKLVDEALENPTNIPKQLWDLMKASKVSESEVQKVVHDVAKNYPLSTPISSYAQDFIIGWILPNWTPIVQTIEENRKKELPFY